VLKITGGEFRSRRLAGPPDEEVSRPYAQRVRETVFNLLRGWFEDASVLDLFAGVGTVGLEAVSRGARRVVMVERDPKIYELLQRNIETLRCGDRVTTLRADALGETALAAASRPVDVVFMDPPYRLIQDPRQRPRVLAQIVRCRRVMAEKSFLVLRSPLGPDEIDLAVEGMEGPEAHRYSKSMWVLLYQLGESGSAAASG
jgi:16S rRNA (guanine(966)-N(2))-methyltransferase RsmD